MSMHEAVEALVNKETMCACSHCMGWYNAIRAILQAEEPRGDEPKSPGSPGTRWPIHCDKCGYKPWGFRDEQENLLGQSCGTEGCHGFYVYYDARALAAHPPQQGETPKDMMGRREYEGADPKEML
jgi:hypothetical protein